MDSISDVPRWMQASDIPAYIRDDPRYTGDFANAVTGPVYHHYIYRRDGRVCQYCGTTTAPAYQIDHVIPLVRGGTSRKCNLVVACAPCNQRKRDAVWIPRNLDLITARSSEWRARIVAEAVPHDAP